MSGHVRKRDLADHEGKMEKQKDEKRPEKGRQSTGFEARGEREKRGSTGQDRLDRHVRREQRALPEVSSLRLGEEKGGIDGGEERERRRDEGEPGREHRAVEEDEGEMCEQRCRVSADQEGALHQPALP